MFNAKCPLCGSEKISVEKNISIADIIKFYIALNQDVKNFFISEEIYILKCENCFYRFYQGAKNPDALFYENLSKYAWYYTNRFWEYKKASQLIRPGDSILEIGAGSGEFFSYIKNITNKYTGLELTKKTADEARSKDINIITEDFSNYSPINGCKYDVIVFFHVLEHIADTTPFFNKCSDLLVKGGKMIISVPNNLSYIQKDKNGYLNMPPHHFGLWGKRSLKSIAYFYPFNLSEIYEESLQKIHYRHYYQVKIGDLISELSGRSGRYINFLVYWIFFYPFLSIFNKFIKGQSIMSVFVKK